MCIRDRREGAPQLAALAYQIPQRPAGLPEGGVDHAVQGLFQFLLVAAAQGKVCLLYTSDCKSIGIAVVTIDGQMYWSCAVYD